jgi:predicted Zn-dependent protease
MPRLCCALLILGSVALAQRNPFNEALEKYQHKQYEEALPLAAQASLADARNPACLHLYGMVLAAVGRLDSAEENLRQAAELGPDQVAYQFDLGALLHQERKYAQAVPVLRRAVALDPENLSARMMLARSYVFSYNQLNIPKFEELTLEQLHYIEKKDPRFPAVHHHLALVYINSGEPAKAVEELNTELQYFPANTQARLELGETLLKLNENHKAAEQLLIAGKEAPQVASIQYSLAKAYKADSQNAKALEAARRCVELDPQAPGCHYLLGQLYRDLNQPDLAKQHFELYRQYRQPGSPAQ